LLIGYQSYRSWLERIRKENPAFLTIVSLELPESPIPLIESQANARWRRGNFNELTSDKNDILNKLLEEVTEAGRERDRENGAERDGPCRRRRRNCRKNDGDSSECTKAFATLEECTRNIIEGQILYFLLEIECDPVRKRSHVEEKIVRGNVISLTRKFLQVSDHSDIWISRQVRRDLTLKSRSQVTKM